MNDNDYKVINEIKALSLDMMSQINNGNFKVCLNIAPILYILYTRHMNINPLNPLWINRDRLVISSCKMTPLIYATLYMCGFKINSDDLKQYSRVDSILPINPQYAITPGVDITVGNPGVGVANAVGFALGERYIENILKAEDEKQELINYRTYVLCSLEDLMTGVSYEASSFVGAQRLDKLMILCEKDKIYENVFTEDIIGRFEAMGFFVKEVKGTNNLKNIDKTIKNAKNSKKPSLIIFNSDEDIKDSLSNNDILDIKRKLEITVAPFEVRKDSLIYTRDIINKRVGAKYVTNMNYLNQIKSSANDRLINLLNLLMNNNLVIPFESLNFKINDTYNENLLSTNHKILNLVASKSEFILGGSILPLETKAYIDNTVNETFENPLGRNIDFGNRIDAMGGILNGISMLGFKTFCSTKLINCDNLKSNIRMSALLNLPVTYIFTHDSINNSEDGTLFVPIEQLITLRSIPNLITFRPCDVNEILGIWEYIAKNKKTVSIILSDYKMNKLPNTNPALIRFGAYIVKKEDQKLDGIIIATGKEVLNAINIAVELKRENLDIRVVSMVSMELFLNQDKDYQDAILSKNIKTIVIEPSSTNGWGMFVTDRKYVLGLDDFVFDGQRDEVLKKCNYDYENLKMKVASLLLNK